jgi:hypothetical protein
VSSEPPPLAFGLSVAGITTALSLVFVWLAVRASRMRRYLSDTPTSPAAGVFIGDVECKGTAESDGPLRTYLSETACVHHTWSITEDWGRWVTETYKDDKGNTRTRQRYETGSTTIASGGEQIPFYLQDETGVILIWPEGARIEAQPNVRFTCGPSHPSYYGKGPPGEVANSLHTRNFHEDTIPLHARIFVAGRARERHDMVAAEIAADKDARLFLISTRDEKQVAGGYGIASWVWAIIGLIVFVAGGLTLAGGMSTTKEFSIPGMAIAILGYPLLLAIAWGWMAFNSIVSLRQRVKRAWSNIEVELKRRADLLPNLAAVVKAARMHDKDTQQVIAILRAQASIGPAHARDRDAKVQGVTRVMHAIAEAYPSISAQPNFLALQQELSNTEARIALARSYYNGIATAFNARLLVVPDRFLAAIARLKPFDLFNATDLERETPRVNFVENGQ